MSGADFTCSNSDCLHSGSLDSIWQTTEIAARIPVSGSGSFHSHCSECSTALWFDVSGSSVIQQE